MNYILQYLQFDYSNKQIEDEKLVRTSQIVSFISGIGVILAALYFSSLEELSLFELMMSVSTMVQVPMMVPLLFGLFVKKTPQWAPWATIAVGMVVSWMVVNVVTPEVFVSMFGIESLTKREIIDMNIILTVGGHLFITAGFFCLTSFFYKEENDKNKAETNRFFEDLETPVIADEQQNEFDRQQRYKLGTIVIWMSIGILLMGLIPNPLWGRMLFVSCSLIIATIGFFLKRSAKGSI